MNDMDNLNNYLEGLTGLLELASKNAKAVILEPAAFSETIKLVNNAAGQLVMLPDHYGECVNEAIRVLGTHGFQTFQVELLGTYIDCKEEDLNDRCEVASELLAQCWFNAHDHLSVTNRLLRSKIEEHFRNHCEMLGSSEWDRIWDCHDSCIALGNKKLRCGKSF